MTGIIKRNCKKLIGENNSSMVIKSPLTWMAIVESISCTQNVSSGLPPLSVFRLINRFG